MAPPPKKDLETASSASMPRSSGKRTVPREVRSASPMKTNATHTPSARAKATPKKRGRKTAPTDTNAADSIRKSGRARKPTQHAAPSVADSNVDSSSEIVEDDDNAAAAAVASIASAASAATEAAAAEAAAEQMVEDAESGALPDDTARVTVEEDVEEDRDGTETKRTSVKVEMAADAPNQPLPSSPEEALRQAKAIMSDAKELKQEAGHASKAAGKKRKADDMETQGPEEEIVQELLGGAAAADGPPQQGLNGVAQEKGGVGILEGTGDMVEFSGKRAEGGQSPAKRTRVMVPAEEFRRQKMQKRALVGLSGALAVG